MPSIILSDNGVSSGNAGLKSTAASDGALALQTTTSGGAATTAVTIDTSQNVGVNTTTPATYGKFVVNGQSAMIGGGAAQLGFYNSDNTNYYALGNQGATGSANAALTFYQGGGGGERGRFDISGNFLVGATATISNAKFLLEGSVADNLSRFRNTNASPYGLLLNYTTASPNGTSNEFLQCFDSTGQRASIRSNGGLANYSANNTNLASDYRLKHAIEPVKSYWNVFKAIEWKTWLYNNQTDEIKNIGVIAQELQAFAPELVCESGAFPTPEGESPYLGLWENDFKMAAMSVITELVKKSEEQQALIDKLTARITALENK